MNTRQVYTALLLLLLCFFTKSLNAQVTIGSKEEPSLGALLDLKESPSTGGGANATKGLGMARVELNRLRGDLASSLGATSGAYDSDKHVGLLIYNVKESISKDNDVICVGMYVWNGEKWDPLLPDNMASKSYYDARTEMLTDHEGNKYPTRLFGSAGRWMTQNLKTYTILGACGGAPVPITQQLVSGSSTEPLYTFPEGGATYGTLYNWAAATNKKDQATVDESEGRDTPNDPANVEKIGVQGICPPGWHLPSDYEWNLLEKEILENPSLYGTDASIAPEVWDPVSNYTTVYPRGVNTGKIMRLSASGGVSKDPHATNANDRGFGVELIGSATGDNVHVGFNDGAYFWTSSGDVGSTAWRRYMTKHQTLVIRHTDDTASLSAVRCKQDE